MAGLYFSSPPLMLWMIRLHGLKYVIRAFNNFQVREIEESER